MPNIVTLAEAKEHLNVTGTAQDAEITAFVDAATAFVERHIGPVVEQTVTETVTPTSSGLIFLSAPVISITSMTAAYGHPGTYTVADWFPKKRSIVIGYGKDAGHPTWPLTIVYVGGYAAVPGDIKQATLDYIKWRWMSQRGATPLPTMGGDEFAMAPTSTVPYKVMEVIDGYRQTVVA